MRKQTSFIGFRATEAERSQLDHLSKLTGLGMSEVLRSLVHTAEVQHVQSFKVVSSGLKMNNRSDVCSGQVQNVTTVGA